MKLQLIDNVNNLKWVGFLKDLPYGSELLVSPVWARVLVAENKQTKLLAWQDGDKVLALTQIVEEKNIFGVFWYLPRGPIFKSDSETETLWPVVLADLKRLAKARNVVAIRLEPSNIPPEINLSLKKINSIQPKKTIMLNLDQESDEILAAMQPKTRYNIRLAKKRGVLIEKGNLEDLNLFYRLLKITTKRDRFRGHSLAHYQKMISVAKPEIELYLAKKDGLVLAAGIFSFYGGRATYLHGASANSGREHMAPHLLQYRMIERAKELGCKYYDFYGIDEKKWPGVTRFKKGFGGQELEYPGSFLCIIDSYRYNLYHLAVLLRRLLGI